MEIYKVTNIVNSKTYIGVTSQGYEKRFTRHLNDARLGSDCHFHRAIRKYGRRNFTIEVLITVDSRDDAYEYEKLFIELYCSKLMGYNETEGGEGRLGYKHSEETKKKLSIGKMGAKNPMYKRDVSKETRQKISKAGKGRKHSEDTKRKISKSQKGKKLAETHLKNLRLVSCKPVEAYINSKIKVYNNTRECSEDLDVSISRIYKCISSGNPNKDGIKFRRI